MTDVGIGITIDEAEAVRSLQNVEDGFDGVRDSARQMEGVADEAFGDVERSAESADGAADDLGLGFSGLAAKAKSLAGPAALGAVVVGLGAAISAGAGLAAELVGLSRVSGLSERSLVAFARVARAGGGDIEDVADAAREMQLRLQEAADLGSGPAVDAMRLLGLELSDIPLDDANVAFGILRDRIAAVEDPAQRLFVAEELLGGSSERLTSLLSAQNDEIAKQRTLSKGQIDDAFRTQVAFDEVGDVMSDMSVVFAGFAAGPAEAVSSAITGLAGFLGVYSRSAQQAASDTEFLRSVMESTGFTTDQTREVYEELRRQNLDFIQTENDLRLALEQVDLILERGNAETIPQAIQQIGAVDRAGTDWRNSITVLTGAQLAQNEAMIAADRGAFELLQTSNALGETNEARLTRALQLSTASVIAQASAFDAGTLGAGAYGGAIEEARAEIERLHAALGVATAFTTDQAIAEFGALATAELGSFGLGIQQFGVRTFDRPSSQAIQQANQRGLGTTINLNVEGSILTQTEIDRTVEESVARAMAQGAL